VRPVKFKVTRRKKEKRGGAAGLLISLMVVFRISYANFVPGPPSKKIAGYPYRENTMMQEEHMPVYFLTYIYAYTMI
jgi:hypothetical protein